MAIDLKLFPLQNSIKKTLDDPNSRLELPSHSTIGDAISVGDGNFDEDEADHYDTGVSPDIALNNENLVVEVHKSHKRDRLFYRVGEVGGHAIGWQANHDYDDGIQPSVAITNDGVVVEVHRAPNFDLLFYRVGRVEGDKINWGGSIEYDSGVQPSVAITNDGLVVEVHRSQNFYTLYYHVGRVEGDKINWGGSIKYDDGDQPSVAITDDGLVVEVHKSQSHDTLWYHVGRVEGDKINWGGGIEYDSGVQPSVAITNDGLVVEVHKSQSHDTLWYRGTGKVNDDLITWGNDKSQNYSNGRVPKVACNGQVAVETHNKGSDELWSLVLTLPAFRPQWFEDRGPKSYCYFTMGSGFGPWENERIATSRNILVNPDAPFLIASITQSSKSIAFPTGAMLIIQAPDGTIYNQEESRGFTQVIKVGSSLQSLVIKEPIAGLYRFTLTVPPNVAFSFAFQTLPFGDLDGIIEGSQELQKRNVDGDREKQVATLLAMLWLIIARERQSLSLLEEPVGYVTKSEVDITDSKVPPDVVQATDIIAAPIYRILTIEDFVRPPATPTPAPVNGPVLEYVRNSDGALLWLHAHIRQNHLGTGTPTNQQIRNFAQRLGIRTDDAGHVIGNQLGGLGTVEWNIFPQNPNFNRGAYSHYVERVFRDAVQRYGNVEVWFRFHYDDSNYPTRVSSFDFCMLLPDGTVEINDLFNPHHV